MTLHLTAALFSPDGVHRVDARQRVPLDHPQAAADLAKNLLDAAPGAIRMHFNGIA
jgi:hydroxymethylbilane synthase